MDEGQRYLFDLQGWVTIPDVLDRDLLAALNATFDEHVAGEVPPDSSSWRFGDVIEWGPAGERRTVFLKYNPHPIAWSARFYDRSRFADLTPRQRAILEPPNARYGGRPTA